MKEHKIKNTPYVYVTEKGNPMHYRCWHRILSEYSKDAKVGEVSPHDLRRSVAKQMHRKGADIFQLQKILGHKNIQTTVIYLDIMGIDETEVIQKYNPFA
jgi:integrase/recombinase XerD